MTTLRENLVLVGDVFCAAKGIGRKRLSTLVLNRGSTLDRLASGDSDVTTGTYERAMIWFSDHWPEGADWPEGIERPVAEEAAP
ncbi:hypothetical protein [Martelella soudanensis]|uniref:hypothetical protein n=1 Tax=unclassified Martelella TaxID=2629616 RepID=UPI0015E04433|nr:MULTISPECIES: hypothetical protein [unclassified Martelella]